MLSFIAQFAKNNLFWIKSVLFLVCLIPTGNLIYEFYTDGLGINRLDRLLHVTGHWALYFLLITLAITPLRRLMSYSSIRYRMRYGKRLSDWNWIIKLRRMLGLYSFFYVCLHFSIYLVFDSGIDYTTIKADIVERPFILMGFICFVLLIPLALTSTDSMMRRLGKYWRHLHRLTYIIAILAILHYWWLTKVGVYEPLWPSVILAIFLGYRLLAKYGLVFKRPVDNGMEVKER